MLHVLISPLVSEGFVKQTMASSFVLYAAYDSRVITTVVRFTASMFRPLISSVGFYVVNCCERHSVWLRLAACIIFFDEVIQVRNFESHM